MEHLWSRAVATNGNRRQTHQPRTPPDYLLSSAIACIQLRRMLHGKEGSTVRVRQRALQKPRKSRLSRSAELARPPVCGRYGGVYGALSSEAASGKRQKLAGQDRAPSPVRGRADIFGGRQRLAARATSS